MIRRAFPLVLAGLLALPGDPVPASAPAPAAAGDDVAGAIRRGVAYLVKSQNRDGSWGSTAPTLYLDIYAPTPAAYEAYAVATSGLAVLALVQTGDGEPGAAEAVRRGTDYLLAHTDVKRASVDVLYNVWAHAYSLKAYAALLAREKDPARREALKKAADDQVSRLERYENVDGGWGYYDFSTRTKKPGPDPASFMCATGLLSLRPAADQGIAVPDRLVKRALQVIKDCRYPRGSFAYGRDLRLRPQFGINKTKGSLARTPGCLLALDVWGEKVPEAAVRKALDELETYGHFLRIARKYPYPHESWYFNSGYFCFYGYYYAACLTELLPAADRPREIARMAAHLLPLQEPDGSWWDYQLYGYHKPYGTAYVLMALGHSRSR